MGLNVARHGLILFLASVSLMAVAHARRTIVVDGPKGWRSGVNYIDWVVQNQPFYYGDTLVFKYNQPKHNNAGHSVYLLPDLWSYVKCDFKAAKLVAGPAQGRGKGFSIVLNEWKPYYFASGEGDGRHDCDVADMKFMAVPWRRIEY